MIKSFEFLEFMFKIIKLLLAQNSCLKCIYISCCSLHIINGIILQYYRGVDNRLGRIVVSVEIQTYFLISKNVTNIVQTHPPLVSTQ